MYIRVTVTITFDYKFYKLTNQSFKYLYDAIQAYIYIYNYTDKLLTDKSSLSVYQIYPALALVFDFH